MKMESHLQLLVDDTDGGDNVPIDQMGRGEGADPFVVPNEYRGSMVANGAFAVGACDMNGLPRELDVLQELGDAFQSRLDLGH